MSRAATLDQAMMILRHAEHADRSPWEYGVCDECHEGARALSNFDLSCALSEIRRSRSALEEPVVTALLDEAARRLGMAAGPAGLSPPPPSIIT